MTSLQGPVIVTGGAGFIGSHLVDHLLQRDIDTYVIDNFDPYYSGKERNVEHNLKNRKFRLIKGDILDFKLLKETFAGVTTVFHLAAQPGVRYSVKNPHKVLRVNVEGTLNVLIAARDLGVDKIVYASSSSVYGIPKHLPTSEEDPLKPISPYGASKVAAEKNCHMFSKLYGMKTVILRYFTSYGPRQRPDMAIHKFTRGLFGGEELTIYGDGSQTRDFTFVEDVVRGTILAAESDKAIGGCFNIGSGKRVTVNDLVRLLEELSKKKARIIYAKARSEDAPHTQANVSKASRVLEYRPKVELRGGLSRFLEWFLRSRGSH